MARITVEDCLTKIGSENRFDLIHLTVKRIKQLRKGSPLLVKSKNKETVNTLREIAAGVVNFNNIDSLHDTEEDARPAKKNPELESLDSILQKS